MGFPDDQLEEVRSVFGNAHPLTEGTGTFLLLRNVRPISGKDDVCDIILIPETCEGYPSRLYFSKQIVGNFPKNWNGTRQFLERSWSTFSWNGVEVTGKRLLTLIQQHLRGLVVP